MTLQLPGGLRGSWSRRSSRYQEEDMESIVGENNTGTNISVQKDLHSVSSEFPRTPLTGAKGDWSNVVQLPPSTGTLNKRSVSRNQRYANNHDTLVKDYSRKRWLILSLLSVEIDRLFRVPVLGGSWTTLLQSPLAPVR